MNKKMNMQEIKPRKEMIEEARKLKIGAIMIVYRDYSSIRMETENGRNPYVWRNDKWRIMRLHR